MTDPDQIPESELAENRSGLEQLLRRLEAEDAHEVKLGFTDVDGVMRGKYLARDKLASLIDSAGGFCDCVFGWDADDVLYDNAEFTGWHTGFPDARFRLVAASERTLEPEHTPFLLAEFVADEAGTRRHPICPRSRFQGVLSRAAEQGLHARMGFEYEFFVFSETPHSVRDKAFRGLRALTPGNFGYSVLRASTEGDRFKGLLARCRDLGIPLEGLHCETGPGVWEAALQVADGIEAADRAALFKTFSKVYFEQQDLMATFMAKWSMDYPGQSGHIHTSIVDAEGRSIFHDSDATHGISAEQGAFVAGLQKYMRELCALFAPTVNSYTRLVPDFWAPTAATWGVENRTCAVRVIPGSVKSQRVEFRAAGADANPYLAAAAVLAAGLQGIEEGLEPDPAVEGNAYDLQKQLPPERHLPSNLRDAAGLLRDSALARDWFGEAFVDHFASTREWEAREYERHVNDWQLARYFEII